MSETSTGPTGQPAQAPAGTDPAAATAQQQQTDTPPADSSSTDWVAEARKWEDRAKANKAAADANKAAADKLRQLEDATKTETQKLLDRATAAETTSEDYRGKYQGLLALQAVYKAADLAGALDAETVYLHIQRQVTVDDQGQVAGVDAAVKKLRADKPHLFRAAAPGAQDTRAGGTPPALNSDALTNALKAAVGL